MNQLFCIPNAYDRDVYFGHTPPAVYGEISNFLPGPTSQEFQIQATGLKAAAVDAAGFEVPGCDVILVTGSQRREPGPNPRTEFKIGDAVGYEQGIICASRPGADDALRGYQTPTGFLRFKDAEKIADQVRFTALEIAREVSAGTAANPCYDVAVLDGYMSLAFETLEKQNRDAVIRLIARDEQGNESAGRNFRSAQLQDARRFAFDSYDAMQTVCFDWLMRSPAPSGVHKESRPLATLASTPGPKEAPTFKLILPDKKLIPLKVRGKATPITRGAAAEWYPLPGLPVYQAGADNEKIVKWEKS